MFRHRTLRSAVVAAALLACAPLARAFPAREPLFLQETAPAASPATNAASTAMTVNVVDVVGMVQVSTDDGKTWKRATKGMQLDQGASFRTGVRSTVTCVIEPDQTFVIESLSTLKVMEAARQGKKVKTELLMKYGATSYGIEAAGAEHEGTIRTPSSTLAVRGTVVRVYDQPPFAPTAESFTGRAFFRNARREMRVGGTSYAAVQAGAESSAQTALDKSVVDPSIAGARTTSESRYIADQVSRGAVLSFDERAQIPVIRNGPGPVSDAALADTLPGRLNFALRWSGRADLNILLDNQPGDQLGIISKGFQPQEILFPGYGLNTSRSGGKIPYDDRGGRNGGMEVGFWQDNFPTGVYGIGALHASGADTDFKFNAFLDKQPLNLYFFQGVDADGIPKLVKGTQYEAHLDKNSSDAVVLFVPANELFESITDDATSGGVTDAAIQAAARRLLTDAASKTSATVATPKPATATPTVLEKKAQSVAKSKLGKNGVPARPVRKG